MATCMMSLLRFLAQQDAFQKHCLPEKERVVKSKSKGGGRILTQKRQKETVQVIKGLLKSGACSPVWLEYVALSVLTLFRTCVPLPCLKDAWEGHQFAP